MYVDFAFDFFTFLPILFVMFGFFLLSVYVVFVFARYSFVLHDLQLLAKGRTNLELREQFILPEGVSQGMSPFKTKAASPNSSVSGQPGSGQIVTPLHARSPSLPTAGPITKVRVLMAFYNLTAAVFFVLCS